ncbi:hypothetical protein [Streptomyces lydicus]|uniref:hypothetical protein n=1 Tax=Streptomyces lydicus TaxID=47763 RepID=UPI001011BE4A|nr:hypothetical protein [Streptomyces lydicus]MCZ1012029.1 hypothetical protein [Streptomyces lydicus]
MRLAMPASVPTPSEEDDRYTAGTRTAAVAAFLARARAARAATELPKLVDGDCVTCPNGYLWVRHQGSWKTPDYPDALSLPEDAIRHWWAQRDQPDSNVAVVHRLSAGEADRIAARHYASSLHAPSVTHGQVEIRELVTGAWLRALATRAELYRTVSVHLEMPSGIVTLHSDGRWGTGDIFYLPFTHPTPPV